MIDFTHACRRVDAPAYAVTTPMLLPYYDGARLPMPLLLLTRAIFAARLQMR